MRAKDWRQGILVSMLILTVFWLGTLIWGLAHKAHIAVSQEHQAEWQYKALETRKAELEANLAALTTERGKDAAIRTAFGVARPGEEVIVVVPPAPVATTTPRSWWQRFLDWF